MRGAGLRPGEGMPWGPFFGGGGWLMQDVWEHYAFSRDLDFLRTYYPVLRGSAEFYLGILVRDANGKLITAPSLSPENVFRTNEGVIGSVVDGSAIEREIIWDLFTNTITASRLLNTDADLRAKLEAAKAQIRPLEIGKAGQIEEWGHDWDLNAPGTEPSSRLSSLRGLSWVADRSGHHPRSGRSCEEVTCLAWR